MSSVRPSFTACSSKSAACNRRRARSSGPDSRRRCRTGRARCTGGACKCPRMLRIGSSGRRPARVERRRGAGRSGHLGGTRARVRSWSRCTGQRRSQRRRAGRSGTGRRSGTVGLARRSGRSRERNRSRRPCNRDSRHSSGCPDAWCRAGRAGRWRAGASRETRARRAAGCTAWRWGHRTSRARQGLRASWANASKSRGSDGDSRRD